MERLYISVLNKHAKFILLTFVAVICLFAYNIKDFQLDASSDTLILEQDEDLKTYREIVNNYGANDFLIVTFTDTNKIVTRNNLNLISSFISSVNSLDWVESVQSIFDAPLLEVNDQSLTDLVNTVLTINSPSIKLEDAENELLQSPIFKNLIISEDSSTTGVLINFKEDLNFEFLIREKDRLNNIKNISQQDIINLNKINIEYDESKRIFDLKRHQNIEEIRNIIAQYGNKGVNIHLGGVSMIADDTITFVKNDIVVFGIGAIIFILIVLFIIFKNPIWMFACITNCFVSLIIMVGIVSILGWKVTVISSNFIMLMLILSLSMTVHIVVRYKQILFESENLSKEEKILLAIKKMYRPCLFAALTTIFAFGTLYTSGIKPVMDFGIMMCAGIAVTYLNSFIFLPILMYTLNLNKPSKLDIIKKTSLFVSASNTYPNLILLLFFIILCLGVYGASTLKVENSFVDYFKKDTEIYKGMKLIDDKLGGTTPLDIIIDFPKNDDFVEEDDLLDFGIEYDKSDYWFTKEKIDTIKQIHDHLESYPFSGKVLSLASVVRTAEKLNYDSEFDTLELSVLYKKLPENLKDQIIKPYVLIDKNQARITMRVIDTHPQLERSKFINDLNNYIIDNYSSSKVNISVAGILILYNNMLESLFESQIKSLSIVLSGIFFMLILLFRSLKIAFTAVLPNMIACFVILGTMGLLSIPLDLMTITIAAITIGIAVDNSIHYVYRYREYLLNKNNHYEASIYCSNSVGIAIKNTSYTIIAGFSILVFSNFYPTIYFGIFTALAMFIALVGSLTILPILLKKLI